MLKMNVQQVYFDAIKDGRKTIEGRLAKDKFRILKAGDSIKFSNNEGTEHCVKTVVATHMYPSFAQSFEFQDFKKAVPNAVNVKDAIHVYEQFYTKEMQAEFGVIFIELQ